MVYSKEKGMVAKRFTPPKQPKDGPKDEPAARRKPEQPTPGAGMSGVAPAWVRGEIEKPSDEKDMGGWTALVYSTEQQARLGVDELGTAVQKLLTMPGPMVVKTKTNLRG